ncbi:hypothetical protein [Vibrio marisflavi]|uniref:Uncharacterized protein n=1 Tax=Vibrio marisflavi CECT 7928 TaxID=634439 RepID=A0ABM9A3R9_9VIBR|nr:hypothetical protein [Vibrio marisflavi]CAH0539457.1 hypothetical protein VMF7928_02164 [Vibrio marisflavi CECT 7928]
MKKSLLLAGIMALSFNATAETAADLQNRSVGICIGAGEMAGISLNDDKLDNALDFADGEVETAMSVAYGVGYANGAIETYKLNTLKDLPNRDIGKLVFETYECKKYI